MVEKLWIMADPRHLRRHMAKWRPCWVYVAEQLTTGWWRVGVTQDLRREFMQLRKSKDAGDWVFEILACGDRRCVERERQRERRRRPRELEVGRRMGLRDWSKNVI